MHMYIHVIQTYIRTNVYSRKYVRIFQHLLNFQTRSRLPPSGSHYLVIFLSCCVDKYTTPSLLTRWNCGREFPRIWSFSFVPIANNLYSVELSGRAANRWHTAASSSCSCGSGQQIRKERERSRGARRVNRRLQHTCQRRRRRAGGGDTHTHTTYIHTLITLTHSSRTRAHAHTNHVHIHTNTQIHTHRAPPRSRHFQP